jgi:hypothetical protein
MGGCGSGRHQGVKKRRVESCLALSVSELWRKGALAPGASGTLTWERDGDAQASIAFRADAEALILCYHVEHPAAPREIEQRVGLSSVPGTYGGTRVYFLCPGSECGRRVSMLYFARGAFLCRQCHGLAYECQREDVSRRALRRADKFRARLSGPRWSAFALTPVTRPRGMWRRTFGRLHGSAVGADAAANETYVANVAKMISKIDRRKRRAGR